jgi:hypothetical protein
MRFDATGACVGFGATGAFVGFMGLGAGFLSLLR